MAKFYVLQVKMGKIKLEAVPERWRATVTSLLEEEESNDKA